MIRVRISEGERGHEARRNWRRCCVYTESSVGLSDGSEDSDARFSLQGVARKILRRTEQLERRELAEKRLDSWRELFFDRKIDDAPADLSSASVAQWDFTCNRIQ